MTMTINDVFRLRDGNIILLVHVPPGNPPILAGEYDLSNSEQVLGRVMVTGQRMRGNYRKPNEHALDVDGATCEFLLSGPPLGELVLAKSHQPQYKPMTSTPTA